MYNIRSFLFSLRVADNERTSPCDFSVRRLGDSVLSDGLPIPGAFIVSNDVELPD